MNADEAANRIWEHFPVLASSAVSFLGEGADHWAFDVADRYVFRFSKKEQDITRLQNEIRLTSWLRSRLPLDLPAYRFYGSNEQGPLSFAGYGKLHGTPLASYEPTAVDLARVGMVAGCFLRALHALDCLEAGRHGLRKITEEDTLLDPDPAHKMGARRNF